jgi:opacity protein-like surface antigen
MSISMLDTPMAARSAMTMATACGWKSIRRIRCIGGVSTGGNGHLQSTSLMVNGQVDLLHNASVTPYVGAGVGYQNIGANVAGLQDTDWKPAYQAEAGLRTDISPKVSLYGEYRFSQSEAADLSDGGVNAHQHFADHGLLAGMTYHLDQ